MAPRGHSAPWQQKGGLPQQQRNGASVRLCVAETVTEHPASRRAEQDLKIRLVGNHLTPGSSLERHGATMTAGGSSPPLVASTGLLKAHVVGVGRLGSFRTITYGTPPTPAALKRWHQCWSCSLVGTKHRPTTGWQDVLLMLVVVVL